MPNAESYIADLNRITALYEQNGYVHLPSQFSDYEIDSWCDEAERLWSLPEVNEPNNFRVDYRATIEGNRVPERLDPITDVSHLFKLLSKDQRILSIVNHIFREDSVLFKDKLIFKPPGVTGYPLHQDFSYIDFFGFEGSQQLAVCIAIDKADDTAGPIEFFPGWHHHRLPSPVDRPGETDERLLGTTKGKIVAMEPGDMVLFHSLCPHRSAPNRSKLNRRLLFFTYNTRSSGDFYDTYYHLGKP
jgi:ectoine hydroxylase-related dioxygenase (phytanoyl-CoA dioxygenase family)